jgi:hypothetical protein
LIAITDVIITQPFSVGGTSVFNNTIYFYDIQFQNTFTWSISDATTPTVQFNNCLFQGAFTLTQTGTGSFTSTFSVCVFSGGKEFGGYSEVLMFNCFFEDSSTFDDQTGGIIIINGGLNFGLISISGGAGLLISGVTQVPGFGASFVSIS